MLRIHFTDGDLARVHLAREPDPVWETLLGLHQLTAPRRGLPVFAPWRRDARARLAEGHLAGPVRMLSTLAPASAGYWPDFLTPGASADGLETALKALRATPKPRLRQEMDRLSETHPCRAGHTVSPGASRTGWRRSRRRSVWCTARSSHLTGPGRPGPRRPTGPCGHASCAIAVCTDCWTPSVR